MIYFLKFFKTPLLLLVIVIFAISCEQPEPEQHKTDRRKSPIAIANIKHPSTSTYVKIVYGQPYKRERDIFGNLVPYGKVWRTGANEATELTVTGEITFGGKALPPGTYTLFSIPQKNEPWTIILNDELGQWGAFEYDSSHDVFRVDVPSVKRNTVTQALTMEFTEIQHDSTNLIIRWDSTTVTIPIQFRAE